MPRRSALTTPLAAAAITLALAAPAGAQTPAPAQAPPQAQAGERPVTMPTRDVDVTYQMAAPGPSGQVRMLSQRLRWAADAGMLRVDPPSPGIFTVMNYHEHKLLVVRDANKSVTIMHTGETSVAPGVSRTAQFQRVGTDSVAGLPCTDWRTQDSAGRPSTVCLTGDGVLLEAKSGNQLLVQAVHVAYGPIDPGVFIPPSDYHPVTPPQ